MGLRESLVFWNHEYNHIQGLRLKSWRQSLQFLITSLTVTAERLRCRWIPLCLLIFLFQKSKGPSCILAEIWGAFLFSVCSYSIRTFLILGFEWQLNPKRVTYHYFLMSITTLTGPTHILEKGQGVTLCVLTWDLWHEKCFLLWRQDLDQK